MIRLGVAGHVGYEGLSDVLATLRRLAPSLGLTLSYEESLHDIAGEHTAVVVPGELDAMLTLGGDGTLLRAARQLADHPVPILGINMGHLGFLTCCPADALEDALGRLARGAFVVEQRMRLDARVRDADGTERAGWQALNDVVLHKGGFARVVSMWVQANGETVAHYAADGIVIATPTGSTAYSMSAHGPIVHPSVRAWSLVPISPHALTNRPIVVSDSDRVSITVTRAREAAIHWDGQTQDRLIEGDCVMVEAAPCSVRLVHPEGYDYYSMLRKKLHWSESPLSMDRSSRRAESRSPRNKQERKPDGQKAA